MLDWYWVKILVYCTWWIFDCLANINFPFHHYVTPLILCAVMFPTTYTIYTLCQGPTIYHFSLGQSSVFSLIAFVFFLHASIFFDNYWRQISFPTFDSISCRTFTHVNCYKLWKSQYIVYVSKIFNGKLFTF